MTATIEPTTAVSIPSPRPAMEHSAFLTRVEPYRIAEETFVLGQVFQPPGAPVGVHMNSMIIRAEEPVIVDTGGRFARDLWLPDALSLVDPEDIRWIFLSHEEPDHEGNVEELMELAPNATLVTSWFAMERLAAERALPLHRTRWLNDGESFSAGDRVLTAIRPPIFDGPATRGLFDHKTGAFWGVDSFGSPVLSPETDAADIPVEMYSEGFKQFAAMVSPWVEMADATRFGASVDRIRSLQPSVVANCHGPAVSGERLELAWSLLGEVPGMDPAPLPGQADLDAILAGTGIG